MNKNKTLNINNNRLLPNYSVLNETFEYIFRVWNAWIVVGGVFSSEKKKKKKRKKTASVRADVLVRDPSLRPDFWSF